MERKVVDKFNTQGSKGSMNSAEVVTIDQASDSAKKVHDAQLILSVSSTTLQSQPLLEITRNIWHNF